MKTMWIALIISLAGATEAAEQVSESTTVKLPDVSISLVVTQVPILSGEVSVEHQPSEKVYREQREEAARLRQSLPTATARKTVTVNLGLFGVEKTRSFVITPAEEAAKVAPAERE